MRIVQIMGGAPANEPTPSLPEGAERWGLNNLIIGRGAVPLRFEGWTRWFDLHHIPHIQERKNSMYSWLCEQTKPIYLWAPVPEIPASIAYPLSEVQRHFNGERLFSSSLDWMLALAIYEKFEQIDLYGWRMGSSLYTHQISSGQFWVDQAREAGIVVNSLSHSALTTAPRQPKPILKPHHRMYGIETVDRALLYSAKFR